MVHYLKSIQGRGGRGGEGGEKRGVERRSQQHLQSRGLRQTGLLIIVMAAFQRQENLGQIFSNIFARKSTSLHGPHSIFIGENSGDRIGL